MKKIKIMLMLLSALTLVGCMEKADNLNKNKSVEIDENAKKRFIIKHVDYDKEIWIDKETGVNYLIITHLGTGQYKGITVMYDKDGKVLISDTNKEK